MVELFRITYETITPESAEQGDAAERGFLHSNGGRDPLEVVDNVEDYNMPLASAIRHLGALEDSGQWFSGVSPVDEDYSTGETVFYSLHPPHNVTPSSYNRIKRLLKAKGLLY